MEAGGIQVKIQGILKRINSEELRNKVNNWHKLLASASSRFRQNDLTQDGVEPEQETQKMGDTSDFMLLSPVEDNPPRNKSPVQLWVDSLPVETREEDMPPIKEVDLNDVEVENFTLGAEAPGITCPRPYPTFHVTNPCGGSDEGSHCSSMESLLEARKPDPEELLLELGFGGSEEPDMLSRIPSRFLQPSKLKGISIEEFLKHQQHMVHTFQSGFSGYRGLTGTMHATPSGIVGKIMDRLREAEVERQHHIQQQQHHHHHQYSGNQQVGYSPKLARLAHNLINKIKCVKEVSVLSPENRNWYESQGDKSPEPSNKRIIIGQQSFIFSKDGSLIESSNDTEKTESSSECATTESMGHDYEYDNKVEKGTNEQSTQKSLNNYEREQLRAEYKSLSALMTQVTDVSISIGSEDEFFNLSSEKRKLLHVGVIEAAVNTYQKRLRELDLRWHFRELLNGHLHKVTNLLDATTSPSVVTIMKEMTCLLRHQESLKQALDMHNDEKLCFNESVS